MKKIQNFETVIKNYNSTKSGQSKLENLLSKLNLNKNDYYL